MKTKLVRIYAIDWEKLKKIKSKHGFPNYAETVGYVLQKFPEMIVSTEKPAAPQAPAIAGRPDFIQIGGGRCDL